MYMFVVAMRKSTLDVEEYKNVDLIERISDENIHIRQVNSDGTYTNINRNPKVYNINVLGVE